MPPHNAYPEMTTKQPQGTGHPYSTPPSQTKPALQLQRLPHLRLDLSLDPKSRNSKYFLQQARHLDSPGGIQPTRRPRRGGGKSGRPSSPRQPKAACLLHRMTAGRRKRAGRRLIQEQEPSGDGGGGGGGFSRWRGGGSGLKGDGSAAQSRGVVE